MSLELRERVRALALAPPGFSGELDLLEGEAEEDSMQRLNTNPLTTSSPSFRGVMCSVTYRTEKNNMTYRTSL